MATTVRKVNKKAIDMALVGINRKVINGEQTLKEAIEGYLASTVKIKEDYMVILQDLSDFYKFGIKVKELHENGIITFKGMRKSKKMVEKYSGGSVTEIAITWGIKEMQEFFDKHFAKYFKILRVEENGITVYEFTVEIRCQKSKEFFMAVYGESDILKGYADLEKQVNNGVFIEVFCKKMLGIKANFSYEKFDFMLTAKRESVEIKSNCYNPFSLNGTGREEREFFPEDTVEGYIRRNCKAKHYKVFENRNPILALNNDYWKTMTKEAFIQYCLENYKIDKRPLEDGGYPVIRIKSSLREK